MDRSRDQNLRMTSGNDEIILLGYCDSEALEVDSWMTDDGLIN